MPASADARAERPPSPSPSIAGAARGGEAAWAAIASGGWSGAAAAEAGTGPSTLLGALPAALAAAPRLPAAQQQAAAAALAAALAAEEDAPARRTAAQLLGALGRQAVPHRAALAGALLDEDVGVRCWAARALAGMGGAAADQEDKVGRGLRDADVAVRCLCVGALAAMGGRAAGRARAYAVILVDSLVDEDVEVRRAAAFALAQLGDRVMHQAAKVADALRDPDPEVRRLAVCSLEGMGENACSHCGDLVERLQDSDWEVRQWAARALERMAPTPLHPVRRPTPLVAYLPRLVDALQDPDPCVRVWVLLMLAGLGTQAASCAGRVMSAMCDPDVAVRCLASGALATMGVRNDVLVEEGTRRIAEGLSGAPGEDLEVRRASALAMALLGHYVGERRPEVQDSALLAFQAQVRRAMRDKDTAVRRGAARALYHSESLEGEEMAELAREALDDGDAVVRAFIVASFAEQERDADRIYSVLVDEREHPNVRYAARVTLPTMGATGRLLNDTYSKLLHMPEADDEGGLTELTELSQWTLRRAEESIAHVSGVVWKHGSRLWQRMRRSARCCFDGVVLRERPARRRRSDKRLTRAFSVTSQVDLYGSWYGDGSREASTYG